MDLAALWKQRRWVHLLALIDQLPGASRFHEVYLNDDEIAEQIAMDAERRREQESVEDVSGPPLRTWTPELAGIYDAIEVLQGIISAQIASAGGKPKKPKRPPRPTTRVDHFRKQIRESKQNAIISAFTTPRP